jgi:ureidoglycolate lyase
LYANAGHPLKSLVNPERTHRMSSTAIETRTITVETVTPENFAPYGDYVAPHGQERLPINLYGEYVDTYKQVIESDQPLEYMITTMRFRGNEVRFIERHMELTQTFIPLGGAPYVLVVAEPDCPEADGIPDVSHMRAFLTPGNVALQIHRGTWHEIPFPLQATQDCLTLSHQALTRGLASEQDAKQSIDRLDVEKRNIREVAGYAVAIELPLLG